MNTLSIYMYIYEYFTMNNRHNEYKSSSYEIFVRFTFPAIMFYYNWSNGCDVVRSDCEVVFSQSFLGVPTRAVPPRTELVPVFRLQVQFCTLTECVCLWISGSSCSDRKRMLTSSVGVVPEGSWYELSDITLHTRCYGFHGPHIYERFVF